MHSTDDTIFRNLQRSNSLRLNCKLETAPSTEDNVVLATPAVLPENEGLHGPGFGWRHLQILLMFLCIVCSYLHRTCLSVALVAMTTPMRPDQEVYDWSKKKQGGILGSFLWGYAITQIPSGYLTTRFGAKRLLGLSLVLSCVISLCIPIVTQQWDYIGLTVLRVCTGLVQGITFPGNFTLLGKWVVPREKSAATAFVVTAQPFGIFLANALSGVIAGYLGWENIFYIFSGLTLTLAVVWFAFVAENPDVHPYISDKELSYIRQSIAKSSSTPSGSVPWCSMLTSLPVIGVVVANVGAAWCLWFFIAALPRYMNDIFDFSIPLNGVVSGAPFLFCALVGQVLGFTSDFIIRKGWASAAVARKSTNAIGSFGPALMFIAVALTPTEKIKGIQVVELALAVSFLGGTYAGFMVNTVDLSPRFSGITHAMGNFVASLTSAVAPPVTGALVDNLGDDLGWSVSFYLAAGVATVAQVFFMIFGRATVQPWNDSGEQLTESKKAPYSSETGGSDPTYSAA